MYGDLGKQSQYCGKNVILTNESNGKSITALVADACPTCESSGSLDLSEGAFGALTDNNFGLGVFKRMSFPVLFSNRVLIYAYSVVGVRLNFSRSLSPSLLAFFLSLVCRASPYLWYLASVSGKETYETNDPGGASLSKSCWSAHAVLDVVL